MLIHLIRFLKVILEKFLESRGYILTPTATIYELIRISYETKFINFGIVEKEKFSSELSLLDLHYAKSQIGQDLFAFIILDYKKNGYFVEFGAFNGVDGSNSYLLESIGWDGILAESSKEFNVLKKNRHCKAYNLAVYSESNLYMDFIDNGSLSTLMHFKHSDHHTRKGKSYKVRTITLEDLLQNASAPSYIDYISIDTEGSEFELLKEFDFSKYRFGVITIEHNFVENNRNAIYELLTNNNYVRVLKDLTEFDDWYLDSELYSIKKNLFKK